MWAKVIISPVQYRLRTIKNVLVREVLSLIGVAISLNVRDYEKFGGGKMCAERSPPPNLGERLSEAKE